MSHVFISYVQENDAIVGRLCDELRQQGIEVWRDREQIQPGQRWRQAIRQAIEQGAFFLACFSTESTERDSTYMNEELTLAIEKLRKRPTDRTWFIPVLLSDCHVPHRDIGGGETLRDLQWVTLWENWQEGLHRIVSVVKGGVREKPTAALASQGDRSKFEALIRRMGLSEQALSILRQFVESGDDELYYANYGGGQWSLFLCGQDQKQLEVTEPRFIEDDLRQLVALGLLSVAYNSDGNPIYGVTRNAVRLIHEEQELQ